MQVPFLQTLDARALRFLIGRLSDPWLSGVSEYSDHQKGLGPGGGMNDPHHTDCLDGRYG